MRSIPGSRRGEVGASGGVRGAGWGALAGAKVWYVSGFRGRGYWGGVGGVGVRGGCSRVGVEVFDN